MYSKFLRILGLKVFIQSLLIFPFYYFYREFVFIPQLRKEAKLCGMEFDEYCKHRFSQEEK